MKNTLLISLLLPFCLLSAGPALADDLLQSLAEDGSFKTLSAAIKTAGLEEILKGAGPFTLFAPNDSAFAKLPKAKLNALLADKAALNKLLSYHVVPAAIGKTDVEAGKVKSLEGEYLALSVKDGVKINKVPVLGQEIHADNGAIHVLESVLMPGKK